MAKPVYPFSDSRARRRRYADQILMTPLLADPRSIRLQRHRILQCSIRCRKTAASLIEYSITTGQNTKCKETLHNSEELLQNYARVLSPLRDEITQNLRRAMFVHQGLVALAGGSVWFDFSGKVVALNTICP